MESTIGLVNPGLTFNHGLCNPSIFTSSYSVDVNDYFSRIDSIKTTKPSQTNIYKEKNKNGLSNPSISEFAYVNSYFSRIDINKTTKPSQANVYNSKEKGRKLYGIIKKIETLVNKHTYSDNFHNNNILDLYVIPRVRNSILAKLPSYGLTMEEFVNIENYIYQYKYDQNAISPIHIRRGAKNNLPRSLVYVPQGRFPWFQLGWHVLLKTHGNVKKIGTGALNKVTFALHIHSGDLKAFRSGRMNNVSKIEIALYCYPGYKKPERFPKGTPVLYQGPYTQRWPNDDGSPSLRLENVPKVGIIMDYYRLGDLFSASENLNLRQKVHILAKSAEGLSEMHRLGISHRDIKPGNILVDENLNPIISDFGMASKTGLPVLPIASRGFESPEMIFAKKIQLNYHADPKDDVWAFGVTMLSLFTGDVWFTEYYKYDHDPDEILNYLPDLTVKMCNMIIHRPNYDYHMCPLLHVILGCLTITPEHRLKADILSERLFRIYDSIQGKYGKNQS